jgi:hypothetical protein
MQIYPEDMSSVLNCHNVARHAVDWSTKFMLKNSISRPESLLFLPTSSLMYSRGWADPNLHNFNIIKWASLAVTLQENWFRVGGELVSLTLRPSFTTERFLVLISVRGWINPRGMGKLKKKNSVTSIGNRTRTFRFVALCLNQLSYFCLLLFVNNSKTYRITEMSRRIKVVHSDPEKENKT